MLSKRYTLFWAIYFFGLTTAQPKCTGTKYTLLIPPQCDVKEAIGVEFGITTISPMGPCDPTKKVCLTVPTYAEFEGKFDDKSVLTISGFGLAAQLPVAYVLGSSVFADPLVAYFPRTADGSAAMVPKENPLHFELEEKNWITKQGCSPPPGCKPAEGLCCETRGTTLSIWGMKGSTAEITFATAANAATLYLPLLVKSETDVEPSPLMLKAGRDGTIYPFSPSAVFLPFIIQSIKQGQTDLTELQDRQACAIGGKCFKVFKKPAAALFVGKMTTETQTFVIGNDTVKNTYIFSNAGNTLIGGFVSCLSVLVAVFVSHL